MINLNLDHFEFGLNGFKFVDVFSCHVMIGSDTSWYAISREDLGLQSGNCKTKITIVDTVTLAPTLKLLRILREKKKAEFLLVKIVNVP